jgi:hypothetical protein
MSLKTVLQQFGHWFVSLFSNLDDAWQKEEPEVQAALVDASKFVQTIKTNVDETPDVVWEILQKDFPNMSENIIINNIQTAANGLDTSIKIVTGDPLQTLANLMAYLKTLTGNNWADKLQSFFKLIAAELAPGTPFEKIALFAQYVYMTFVQPHES